MLRLLQRGQAGEDRAKLAAEDLAIGLGASILGQLGGAGIGRAMVGKRFGAMNAADKERLGSAMTFGDIAAGPLNMVAPRPIMEDVYQRAALEAQEQQQAEMQGQLQEREQALIQALLGSGLLLK